MKKHLSLFLILLSFLTLASLAGILPRTVHAQTVTPTITATLSTDERVKELEEQIAEFETPAKDKWDILSVISNVLVGIAGVFISIVSGWATYVYNKRKQEETKALESSKLALTKAEVVKEHLPTLLSRKSKDVELTLMALASIDLEMAQRLAEHLNNKNAINALNKMIAKSHKKTDAA